MKLGIRDAAIGYKNHLLASHINMTSEPGQIMAILGQNGCGKTTFVKSLMKFVPWCHGGAFIDGVDMRSIPDRQLWQKMAYVSQKSTSVPYSVLDMVLLGRNTYKSFFAQPDDSDKKMAEAALERVGMLAFSNHSYDKLSVGQQQLIKLARALVSSPELLIMDEPESGLDLKHTARLIKIMQELCKDENRQILFITHSPEHALMIADKAILFLPEDKSAHTSLVLQGDAKEILCQENLERAYGIPLRIIKDGNSIAIVPKAGRCHREQS